MRKRWAQAAVSMAVLVSLMASTVRAQTDAGYLTEEFHQTYALSADGRVSLSNINGKVRIFGWDRNEVKVDAIKKARFAEDLKSATIKVDASPSRIHIETEYDHVNWNESDRRQPASVEYTVSVPRTARVEDVNLVNGSLDLQNLTGGVEASSVNGGVKAQGLSGRVELSVVNGRLDAVISDLSSSNSVTLSSVNGQLMVTIPSDANAHVKASSVHGSITNDFGLPVREGQYVGRDLEGQLGTGATRVRLSNVNGTLSIKRAADNKPLGPVKNLLSETPDSEVNFDGDEQRELSREIAREVREAAREAREAIREATRERGDATRDAARDRDEARREAEREKAEAERERAEAIREAESERTELEKERAQARREAAREREEARREAAREKEEARREASRETTEAQREALREAREAAEESRREIAEAAKQAARETRDALREARGENRNVFGSGDDWRRQIERDSSQLVTKGTPRVRIETFDGPITVHAWDKAEVSTTFIKRAFDEKEMKGISIRSDVTSGSTGNSEVLIRADFDKAAARGVIKDGDRVISWNSGASVEMDVFVPRNSTLLVSSGDGRLLVEGVNGQIELHTGDGAIDVARSQGRVKAKTGDGRILIEDFDGEAEANTGDGRITLAGNFRQLSARTGDGTISLALPEGTNATIETDAESVSNEGIAQPESQNENERVRRWRVGNGGQVFTLRAGDGRIILRRR